MFAQFLRKKHANRSRAGGAFTKKNGHAGIRTSNGRRSTLRRVAVTMVMFVVAGLAVQQFLLPNLAFSAFLGPSTISVTDGVFTDWGTTGSPASGIANLQDAAESKAPSPGLDIDWFWLGFSTADGTAPSGSNSAQNFYFRVDTFDTGDTDQNFNIQLNLGAAGGGKADHLLQMRAHGDGDSPEVSIVLFEYDQPFPGVGAFTTGAVTGKVANVSGFGDVDTNAVGAIQLHDATHYGFEVKIPIDWFSSAGNDYGGNFEADGSGASSVVTSIFTSTGTLGSVGTPKDVINDADGNTIATVTVTATGGTDVVSLIPGRVVITSSAQTITAGSASTAYTVQTQNTIGPRPQDGSQLIDLSSDSGSGSFSTTSGGATPRHSK